MKLTLRRIDEIELDLGDALDRRDPFSARPRFEAIAEHARKLIEQARRPPILLPDLRPLKP